MANVIIRADASIEIGTGHVMRCMTLAERLRAKGLEVAFVCNLYDGHLCDVIAERGFAVHGLTPPTQVQRGEKDVAALASDGWREDASRTIRFMKAQDPAPDLLIVDHYALDAQWERAVGGFVKCIMVIDDLGDRPHACSVLLDQNLHDDSVALYRDLVLPATRCFFGPRYSLLRPEFDAPELQRVRDGSLHRMLVFFGGTDVGNQASRVLAGLRLLGSDAPLATVVLGPTNPARREVWNAARDLPGVTVLDSTDRMAQLVAAADLAVGTCGFAAWERCALGLPAVVTITADNQRDDARILQVLGACINLGDWESVSAPMWADVIRKLADDPAKLERMAGAARGVMSGRAEASLELMGALDLE